MKIRDAGEARDVAAHIAKKEAKTAFGIAASSVHIDAVTRSEWNELPVYNIHGSVTIVTRPKGFLREEQTEYHDFVCELLATDLKLVGFQFA
jgi:hypothetical protein